MPQKALNFIAENVRHNTTSRKKLMYRLDDIKDLGLWVIRLFRKPLTIYVIVSKNWIQVKNLSNGKTVSGQCTDKFSTNRLLIADSIKAENFTKNLIKQVVNSTEISTRKLKLICHPIDDQLADLAPVEKMIFNDFAFQLGGSQIKLIEGEKELTDEELIELNYA